MRNEEFYNGKEAGKMLRISSQTLRLWDKQGKVRSIRTPSIQRLYYKSEINSIFNSYNAFKPKKRVCYARVSSKKQKDDLERQIAFYKSNYPEYEIFSDVGSGINWKRKGLQTLLEHCMRGEVGEVVVSHKDRLCRFGFELVEFLFARNNVQLTLLDDKRGESPEQELAEDIISIVHVYACREYGKRRYKSKKIENISNTMSKENSKELDGNNPISLE